MTLNEVIDKHRGFIMTLPGVTGIGIGKENDEQVVVVLVKKANRKVIRRIPAVLEGFRVLVRETGDVQAF